MKMKEFLKMTCRYGADAPKNRLKAAVWRAGVLSCLLLTAGPAAAGEGPGAPDAPAVAAGRVFESNVLPGRRLPARVVSPATVEIVARVSGEITEQAFRDGACVRKGDVLYRLDPVRYEAAVQSAKADLAEAEAEQAWARAAQARAKTLFERNAGSREKLDEAVRTARTSEAAVGKARAALVLAEDDLAHATITSPMDGRAGVSTKTRGSWVTASSDALVTVVSTDPVRVRFAVSLRDVLERFEGFERLLEEGRVRVTLADGSRLDRTGRITVADNAAGGDTDTIDLYAEFPNADGALMPGASVAVTLERAAARAWPAVTPAAVSRDAKGPWVWVLREDSTVERRRIVVRAETADAVLVEEGLGKGERVVVDGVHKPVDGGTVRVVREE